MILTSPRQVSLDGTFTVSVVLASGFLSRGGPLQLNFDAGRLQLIGVEEGGFFRQGNTQTTLSHEAPVGTGVVAATVMRTSADGVSGTDSVLNLTFRAVADGAARIQLAQASLIALEGAIPPVQLPGPLIVEIK